MALTPAEKTLLEKIILETATAQDFRTVSDQFTTISEWVKNEPAVERTLNSFSIVASSIAKGSLAISEGFTIHWRYQLESELDNAYRVYRRGKRIG